MCDISKLAESTDSGLRLTPCSLFPGSTKCPQPKMRDHRGATWDQHKIIDTAGGEHTGYLDTSWGQYFYFPHDGQWRKARIDRFMTGSDNTVNFSSANTQPSGQ